jgi:hypothetical protein
MEDVRYFTDLYMESEMAKTALEVFLSFVPG